MEMIIFLVLMFLGFASLTIFSVNKIKNDQTEQIGKAFARNMLKLNPNSRYILSFPFEISDEEFDEVVENITLALDLENSDTHVVIVQGKVTMIEFN